MTAINFPASPKNGDTFVNGDVTYTWDGVKWTAKGADPGHVLKAGDTMTGNLTVPSINGGPLAGFRNVIINGDMRIAQRGTTVGNTAAGPDGYYGACDRWTVSALTGQTWGTQQVTTQDGTYGIFNNANGAYNVVQAIEWVNAVHLSGKTATISFTAWALNATPALIGQGWQDSAGAPLPGSGAGTNKAINITTTPTRFTFTFTVPVGPTTPADGFVVGLANLDADSDLRLADFQFEIGPVATPFERRPIGTELALCQRFYQTRSTGTVNAANLRPTMRATPTISGNNYDAEL